jgi:exosortase A
MSVVAVNESGAGLAVRRLWGVTLAALGVGTVAFIAAFFEEVRRALVVWDESTAYNHCYLILPIVAYLIWERWRALYATAPEPTLWPLAAMVPVALVWLFAANAQIMEGRQLAAMTLFELFLFALLGKKVWRIVAFALLYLYFLVPAGAFITPYLQTFAARFAVKGVELLGIPIYSDGYHIEVPGARFEVAEACAGLRFLIASVALGTLYGYTMYRSWRRRAAFMAVSIVVPIIANGFRVLGIVVLGYILGNAQAAVADHLIYGWVFFSLVSLILILLGLPFRQAVPAFPVTPVEPRDAAGQRTGIIVVGAVVALFVVLLTRPIVVHSPVGTALGSAASTLKHLTGH